MSVRYCMNFNEMIRPFFFALAVTAALQYFFFDTHSQPKIQTTFVAPKSEQEYIPLINTEVDFFDQKRSAASQLTEVETSWGALSFSTDGASLESLDIKRIIDKQEKMIRTIFPVTDTERENRCFLVGLSEKTPFYYALRSFDEDETAIALSYQAATDECSIIKTFTIKKDVPTIDMSLTIVPRNSSVPLKPRIFYPAPLMPDIREYDTISSVVIDGNQNFSKKSAAVLDSHVGWFSPEFFGSDSRYFIHAMIKDDNHFCQRAYYKLVDRDRLFSIVEGPKVTEMQTWTISFYCGPKDVALLSVVDERLEKTLDFSGWLSRLSKVLLYILNWFFSYVHNYGLAIILLTMLIHLLLLPFTVRNNEEKFKKAQRDYQSKLAMLEYRYKDNPDQLNIARAELIKKEGFPGMGCIIPWLLQLPIFFALNRVLSSSFELYQAPMLWIKDLSSKDPYYILPIIVTIAMLGQDMKGDAQQRMAKIMMAFAFGAITSSFSAGLAIYIVSSRAMSMLQALVVKYFKLG